MKILQKVLMSIVLTLIVLNSYAQTPIESCRTAFDPEKKGVNRKEHDDTYNKLYSLDKSFQIIKGKLTTKEVKSKNPKYSKVYLFGDYIKSYQMTPNPKLQLNNNEKYTYLYMAYVELANNAKGDKKEQVLLFYSGYNIRAKQKYKTDTKTAFEKEIVEDIDKNTIVLAETQPDVFYEVNKYYEGSSSPNVKAFGTTINIYDINSLHPNNTPLIIGKLFQYKTNLLSSYNYESSMLINYNQNGKTLSTIEYINKEGGYTLSVKRMEKLDEKGKVTEVNFNNIFGMNITNGEVYFNEELSIPEGVKKQWSLKNIKSDLLKELSENLGRNSLENKEQLREFLVNFQKLNEYVIIDQNKKNVYGVPVRYIYKGTYNKEGVPNGWGLMYASNQYDDEYFLGQFKNGLPDGLGIRNNFNLDKPEIVYSSQGMHVGNTLIYGTRITNIPNYGHNLKHGDFRQGELNGKGIDIAYQSFNSGVGTIYIGDFKNGKSHGTGNYYTNNKLQNGVFDKGLFVSGDYVTDKKYDNNYYPGAVVLYQGKKYVIMKKQNDMILLDNGTSVSTKADLKLTGERSLRSKACLVCNGTGYLKPVTNTVFSGVTKTKKTYETGPSGQIVWEKTTTTTTDPVTTHRIQRCTACSGGLAGSEPVPLKADQR